METKELVHIAGSVRQALLQLRKKRYLECVQQLAMFLGTLHELTRQSRKMGLALSKGWFAAAERCCRSIGRRLDDMPFAVSKVSVLLQRRQKKVPRLSELVRELEATAVEFGGIEFNAEENSLGAVTSPITLQDIHLGPFRIALFLDRLADMYKGTCYYVFALEPNPAATDDAITHPHVSNDVVCEGDGAAAIRAALEEGRLCDLFMMVRGILETYNPDSPYVSLAEWSGIPCYECGYMMDSESSDYCSFCEHTVCEECAAVCASCAEVVCQSCAGTCEICEQSLCPQCAKTKCNECESVCCESCLDDGLCPECREERKSDEKPETEDHKETTREQEETTVGGRLADGRERAGAAYAAVQPDGVGQAPVLPGPVRQ
jgi:hypothetical protein